jgi:chromate transport protein ChrA
MDAKPNHAPAMIRIKRKLIPRKRIPTNDPTSIRPRNKTIQAFLAGVSAAVVGVIAVVSLELIPQALVGRPAVVIFVVSFLLIVWLKRDVALVAVASMVGGLLYALARALL